MLNRNLVIKYWWRILDDDVPIKMYIFSRCVCFSKDKHKMLNKCSMEFRWINEILWGYKAYLIHKLLNLNVCYRHYTHTHHSFCLVFAFIQFYCIWFFQRKYTIASVLNSTSSNSDFIGHIPNILMGKRAKVNHDKKNTPSAITYESKSYINNI